MLRTDVNRKLLVDKLCERWVVEKTAVELYDRAIEHAGRDGARPDVIARFEEIRSQEKDHEEMLEEFIRGLGWDPKKETPSAAVALREGAGLLDVCSRADAHLPHVLHALLTAELVDNAGWELLIDLATEAAVDEIVLRRMRAALRQEKEHLHWVRTHLDKMEREELVAAST
jgi:rubrerythrin